MPGLESGHDDGSKGPPNWAYIDRKIMEAFSYTLPQLWELTIPEIAVHLEKLSPTVAEPEWFVAGWRKAKGDLERLELLAKMMRE